MNIDRKIEDDEKGEQQMEKTYQIGSRLSGYRKAHGLTIKELAVKTGLSTALLSELERGIGNPTLSVLENLAGAMGISVSALLEQEVKNASLVRRRCERSQTGGPDARCLYDVLAVSPVKSRMELLLLELEPGMYSNDRLSVHPYWEEIAYVVSGTVEILFEEEEIELKEGDTIRILPGRGHRLMNQTDERAMVLFAQESR